MLSGDYCGTYFGEKTKKGGGGEDLTALGKRCPFFCLTSKNSRTWAVVYHAQVWDFPLASAVWLSLVPSIEGRSLPCIPHDAISTITGENLCGGEWEAIFKFIIIAILILKS